MKSEIPITIEDLLAIIHLALIKDNQQNPVFKEFDELTIKLKEKHLDKLCVNEIPIWKALTHESIE